MCCITQTALTFTWPCLYVCVIQHSHSHAIHTDLNSSTQTALTLDTHMARGGGHLPSPALSLVRRVGRTETTCVSSFVPIQRPTVYSEAAEGADPRDVKCQTTPYMQHQHMLPSTRKVQIRPPARRRPARANGGRPWSRDHTGHCYAAQASPPPPCLHTTPGALLLGGIPLPLLGKIGIARGSVSNCASVPGLV